jgi:hypothetical protein
MEAAVYFASTRGALIGRVMAIAIRTSGVVAIIRR